MGATFCPDDAITLALVEGLLPPPQPIETLHANPVNAITTFLKCFIECSREGRRMAASQEHRLSRQTLGDVRQFVQPVPAHQSTPARAEFARPSGPDLPGPGSRARTDRNSFPAVAACQASTDPATRCQIPS